jgi:hypothetical protein
MKYIIKRSKYSRVSSQNKELLIDLVINKKIKLCEASKLISIKYSTAKTLMRLYRKKNLIFRKDIEEEKKLKLILENRIVNYKKNNRIFFLSMQHNKNEMNKIKINLSPTYLERNILNSEGLMEIILEFFRNIQLLNYLLKNQF